MKYCTDCSGEVAIPVEDCRKRRVEMNKPDVLSDNKICELAGNKYLREGNIKNRCDELVPIKETGSVYLERCLEIAQAQRDADAAYYEPLIQQAKEEVADKIFEEIEKEYMIKDSPNPDFLRNGIVILSPEQWQALKEMVRRR